MQPFIMSLSLCLLGFAVCVVTFALATGANEEEQTDSPKPVQTTGEGFFLDEIPAAGQGEQGAEDPFLSRLRAHVLIEQAAARAFLDLPNPESLHAPADSPLWH